MRVTLTPESEPNVNEPNDHMPRLKYTLQQAIVRSQRPEALAPDDYAINLFLAHCHRRKYTKKSVIMRPGDPATTLFYVISGSVAILSEDDNGRELILTYVNRGEFIGEMGLFVESPHRDVTMRTRNNCELAEITYERLFQLFQTGLKDVCPKILFAIGQQLSNRLLQSNRKVSRLAFMDVSNRIARTLVDLCTEPDAMSHPEGTQIRISRQEISRIVGCSREMVGRVLKEMAAENLIQVSGKTIVILGTR